MTRFAIDGFDFDAGSGVIHTLERGTRVYTTPTSPHVGVQILPPRGPEFNLTLTRYCAAGEVELLTRALVAKTGHLVTIIDHQAQYIFLPWRLRFLVSRVQIDSADVIPHALTTRNGQRMSYSPAGVVVSTWTLHAVPAA